MVDEGIGQDHLAESQAPVKDSLVRKKLRDKAAETADGTFLDGDQRLMRGNSRG